MLTLLLTRLSPNFASMGLRWAAAKCWPSDVGSSLIRPIRNKFCKDITSPYQEFHWLVHDTRNEAILL